VKTRHYCERDANLDALAFAAGDPIPTLEEYEHFENWQSTWPSNVMSGEDEAYEEGSEHLGEGSGDTNNDEDDW
jgi:hypothetical protein